MPDDDDNVVHIRGKSLFGDDYQQKPAERPTLNSTKDAIEWLNKTYATIILNGKFRVLHEKPDGTIEFMDKKDMINNLDHIRLLITSEDGKPKSTPITEIWFKSPSRRMYDSITFDPSRAEHYNGYYNLFKGYKIKPVIGDCTLFLNYVKNVICSGDNDNFNYLVALIAQMIQQPHMKPGIAVVIRGDEGVGKSFFIEKLGSLLEGYYFKTSNPNYIFGDHNGQLKNTILLHLEEAVWAGSKRDESLLKDLITGRTIEINDKFVPVYSVPNHLHLFISGNPDWLVSAGFKARRIFALHASEAHIRDTKYFAELDNWFKNGGSAALIYYFLNYNVNVDLRMVPITEELIIQKQQSMSGVAEWLYSIADTLEMPYGDMNRDTGCVRVIKKLLYLDYSHSTIGRRQPLSDRKFGAQLLSLLPLVVDGQELKEKNGNTATVVNVNNIKIADSRDVRRDGYEFPDGETIRMALEFKLGGKIRWSNDGGSWVVLRGNTDFDFSLYKPDGG
jgi:Family of unknown function (DUF5906)